MPEVIQRINDQQLESTLYAAYPVQLAKALGIDPDPWQEEVILSKSKRILLNCARQSGKSTIVAFMAIHHAMYHPGAMVLIISHTYQQAAETFKKVSNFYRQVEIDWERPENSSEHRMQLTNGARIITLSGQRPDSIRGFSAVTLLIIDEAAQVMDESYNAARPMLATSGGKIILLSTPHGKRGFYWDTWSTDNDWLKVEISADQCPRLSKDFLREEKNTFPDWFYLQEYFNHFAEGLSNVFKSEDIDRAFHPGIFVRDDIDMEPE
jgi:Terminase large subunit, T4likevirus-type, N-terminal